ncbi:MAG: type 1 glutamine amidotransferase [Candidatus Krumholzibacteriota bacterium]|nr:type 1 glutamine amidotransferase [Candidatus Krumholzibacteriota bacterium]
MTALIHLIDVTGFTLPDGTGSRDWFGNAFADLGLTPEIELRAYDGISGRLPAPGAMAAGGQGIIISGSRGSVNEDKPWIAPLIDFIREAHRLNAWILGICFGHQLLAKALGGTVEPNRRGREMGTVPIYLTPQGEQAPLLRGLRSGDWVNLVHRTHVTKLPPGAVRLAFNQMTPTQAFQAGRSFGFQPHPELGPEQLIQLTGMYREILINREGFLEDEDHLRDYLGTFRETPRSRAILLNYVRMISS